MIPIGYETMTARARSRDKISPDWQLVDFYGENFDSKDVGRSSWAKAVK